MSRTRFNFPIPSVGYDEVLSHVHSGPLLSSAIRPSTQQLYETAAAKFISYYARVPDAYCHVSHIDQYLSYYLTYMYLSKTHHIGHANNTLFGLIHLMPDLKDKLPAARRCLKGWKKTKETKSHPPMSWDLCCLLAIQLCSAGWYAEGLAVLIMYDGYFRINELLRLKVRHMYVDHSSSLVGRVATYLCRLKETKTGRNKLVTLTRPELGSHLISFLRLRTKSPSDYLFDFTPQQFRHRFKLGCSMLNWSAVKFVPHSLRHGHASDDFIAGVPIETILVRGRWASINSTRNYIQAGRVHLIRNRLSAHLPLLHDSSPTVVLGLMSNVYVDFEYSLSQ